MNHSNFRSLSANPPRRSPLRSLTVVMALSIAACSGRKSSPELAHTPDEQSNRSDDAPDATGSGHLHVTGDLTVDHDFVVDACQIAPPGDGLLAGYHMNAKDGDSTIVNLTVVVKQYDKDGAYSPAYDNAGAQVGEVMATGSMDFMTLMMTQKGSPMPVGIMLKPESKLVATISGNGSKGEITFTDMESAVVLRRHQPEIEREAARQASVGLGHVDVRTRGASQRRDEQDGQWNDEQAHATEVS